MSAIGSILSNDGALTALNSLRTSSDTTNTLESELSSGKSINSPADNPAGYITAQGFTSQVNGLTQALSNANQGISLLQTAQGAINQETGILQQLNSIAVQASNGTQTPAESQSLQSVVAQMTSQVDTIANQTQFNNINLLDGSFSGVDFQVGANSGQTISLSISSAKASAIGMQASGGVAAGLYGAAGTNTSVYTAGGAVGTDVGAFTTGNLVIDGSNGQATVAVGDISESAASVAAAINGKTNVTNVAAQATNSVRFTATGTNFAFTLSNGNLGAGNQTNAVAVSASSVSGLVDAINGHTATTGVAAQLNSDGSVSLTQASGENIVISNMTAGTLTDSNANATVGSTTTPTAAVYQGVVQMQSDSSFGIDSSSTANIGLATASQLQSLSSINVSTAAGAQSAINVIKYALQGLGAQGGQLGAVQQRLQANVNSNETTVQNLSSALSVVEDANIPQVSQQLTQQQVLQAAGISALKNSSTLQQMYAKLLP